MKDKLHKGELSIREKSPMTENSLARAPRNGSKTLLGWMVTGGLWGQKVHIKLSANDRTPLAELWGRDQKAQRSKHATVALLCYRATGYTITSGY